MPLCSLFMHQFESDHELNLDTEILRLHCRKEEPWFAGAEHLDPFY